MSKAKHAQEAQVDDVAENTEVVDTEQSAAVTTEVAAEPTAEKKSSPIPRTPRFADTGVITLLADKDGKKYGPENNPKKSGSASADRFAKYVDGQTVAEAKAAGVVNGDFANDTDHGYISIV